MKRKELIRLINEHERIRDKKVTFREGGNHTIYTVGNTTFPIGRHVELRRSEVRSIVRELSKEFGTDWRGNNENL